MKEVFFNAIFISHPLYPYHLEANRPRKRDYEKEQEEAKLRIREAEEASGEKEVRQRNEGGYEFSWDEDSPGICAYKPVFACLLLCALMS